MSKHFAAAASVLLLVSMPACPSAVPETLLFSVSPDSGPTDERVEVVVTGEHLVPALQLMLDGSDPLMEEGGGFELRLGEVALEEVVWRDGSSISAVVPAGLEQGVYDLMLDGPAGQAAVLGDAYEVIGGEGPSPVASRFWLEPSPLEISVGESVYLRAFESLEDGTARELSGERLIAFEAEAGNVDVSDVGVVTGVSEGRDTLTADYADHSASVEVNVLARRLDLLPGRLLMAPEQEAHLRLVVVDSAGARDVGAEAEWESSEPSVADVTGGEVLAGSPGVTTIVARYDGLEAAAEVRVVSSGGGTVVLGLGEPWHAAGSLELDGLDLPAGSAVIGYGPGCLVMRLGAGGLTVHEGAKIDVSGRPGMPGSRTSPIPPGIGKAVHEHSLSTMFAT
ncbi:MAG: Ig-like domain-containing protein, partial [Myxococcota bacterium]